MEDVPPMFDADGAISREYLLYRGYCCRSGCRNCPYGYRPAGSGADGRSLKPAPGSDGASTPDQD